MIVWFKNLRKIANGLEELEKNIDTLNHNLTVFNDNIIKLSIKNTSFNEEKKEKMPQTDLSTKSGQKPMFDENGNLANITAYCRHKNINKDQFLRHMKHTKSHVKAANLCTLPYKEYKYPKVK